MVKQLKIESEKTFDKKNNIAKKEFIDHFNIGGINKMKN